MSDGTLRSLNDLIQQYLTYCSFKVVQLKNKIVSASFLVNFPRGLPELWSTTRNPGSNLSMVYVNSLLPASIPTSIWDFWLTSTPTGFILGEHYHLPRIRKVLLQSFLTPATGKPCVCWDLRPKQTCHGHPLLTGWKYHRKQDWYKPNEAMPKCCVCFIFDTISHRAIPHIFHYISDSW